MSNTFFMSCTPWSPWNTEQNIDWKSIPSIQIHVRCSVCCCSFIVEPYIPSHNSIPVTGALCLWNVLSNVPLAPYHLVVYMYTIGQFVPGYVKWVIFMYVYLLSL